MGSLRRHGQRQVVSDILGSRIFQEPSRQRGRVWYDALLAHYETNKRERESENLECQWLDRGSSSSNICDYSSSYCSRVTFTDLDLLKFATDNRTHCPREDTYACQCSLLLVNLLGLAPIVQRRLLWLHWAEVRHEKLLTRVWCISYSALKWQLWASLWTELDHSPRSARVTCPDLAHLALYRPMFKEEAIALVP